jgi:hypothetical protein
MEMAVGLYCQYSVLECCGNTSGSFLIRNLSGKRISSRIVFFTGFLLLGHRLCMVYLYFLSGYYPSICPPYFCREGTGIIIYSACFLLISGMPEEYVSNATALGTTTRFWTTAIGYA